MVRSLLADSQMEKWRSTGLSDNAVTRTLSPSSQLCWGLKVLLVPTVKAGRGLSVRLPGSVSATCAVEVGARPYMPAQPQHQPMIGCVCRRLSKISEIPFPAWIQVPGLIGSFCPKSAHHPDVLISVLGAEDSERGALGLSPVRGVAQSLPHGNWCPKDTTSLPSESFSDGNGQTQGDSIDIPVSQLIRVCMKMARPK